MKEKWTAGKTGGAVVSDTPNRHGNDENVDYYGGHLIAESIPKQEYVNLIAAAPHLLGALELLESNMDGDVFVDAIKREMYLSIIRAAITKAKGGE